MARPSRPPGFDMTYRPMAEFFGPPWPMRLPSMAHGGLALLAVLLVFLAQRGILGGGAHHYLFRQRHLIDPYLAVGAFGLSAVLSMVRDSMRGVQIRPNWIEYRELLSAVWPRVRRYRWAQIEGICFEEGGAICVDLWDGRREFLPQVGQPESLRRTLSHVARARAIPLSGQLLEDLFEEEAA
jgi:hypothetical protein